MAIKVSGTEVISDDKRILNNEDLPDIRPSLLLDFANSKTLDPRITFTRGSTATYWDGKTTAKAEENLFYRSQDFEYSYWSKARVDVTANATTAPDGTTTADAINQASGETTLGRVFRPILPNSAGVTTVSVYAKANTRNFLAINTNDFIDTTFNYTWFNLSTGAVGTTYSEHTASITDAGNGWYRCSITFTSVAAGADGDVGFAPADTDGSTTVTDDQKGIYIWGAQLEQRSSATAYTATTSNPIVKYQPVLQTAASGEARFDHDPVTGESKGLLIEEARTNLYQNSEIVTDTDQSSITSNTLLALDGTLTADKVVENTANNEHGTTYANYSYTSGTTYTFSVYAKYDGTRDGIRLLLPSSAFTNNLLAYYDLSAGTVRVSTNSSSHPEAYAIEDVGNGWYRCSITATATVTATSTACQVRLLDNPASDGTSYTGDGYSGVFLWGAQVEEGSFPTSYIPTSGSTVTRAQDDARVFAAQFSPLYNPVEGTMFAEFSSTSDDTGYSRIWDVGSSSTNDNRFTMFHVPRSSSRHITVEYRTDNSTVASLSPILATDVVTDAKVAATWAQDDFAVSGNGNAVLTDTSGSVHSSIPRDALGIGGDPNGGSALTGTIKKLAYYPKRLPNATLQAMTEA